MIRIDTQLEARSLLTPIRSLFELSAQKIERLKRTWDSSKGTPVYTVEGKYTSRGWTEWTQGFQFGSSILQFDAGGDTTFLDQGRTGTVEHMATHVSHVGVHDHGFNNVSTYGNLLRLMHEGRIAENPWEQRFYELALKTSGAVQAARWTDLGDGSGYIYSFNGPHSLFADTIRSLRALAVAHQLGHVLMGERDRKISLLERILQHAETTARFAVYFGEGRDSYDVRGRVAHESIFNTNDRSYRCPGTQQGYSPFSTWTRGLAWILCGYAEEAEFMETRSDEELQGKKSAVIDRFIDVACAVADFYIEQTPADGIPYWDTGAPRLVRMGDYLSVPANPFNDHEPVDSSAAAIAAQGLIRLGHWLSSQGGGERGKKYFQAGLTVARTLFGDPYISRSPDHEGLILHSVYHRPNGWDYIPPGRLIPMGEATMWGDYHARELALLILRLGENKPYLTFFLR
ncbi:MAG: glycosyl hydrolase [Ignavibacteria bacterium]|nr:glycosyl hydrolase [Ignavibacteria bacterium]